MKEVDCVWVGDRRAIIVLKQWKGISVDEEPGHSQSAGEDVSRVVLTAERRRY